MALLLSVFRGKKNFYLLSQPKICFRDSYLLVDFKCQGPNNGLAAEGDSFCKYSARERRLMTWFPMVSLVHIHMYSYDIHTSTTGRIIF